MDKQQRKIYDRNRYLEKREEFLERDRQRRISNPRRGRERATNWGKRHPRELSIIQARSQLKLKTSVLTHYGNGKLQCFICGEKRIDCLSLDHVNNDGQEHRRRIGKVNIYRLLKRQGYPIGYQTLCMNCQFIKKAENQRRRRLSSK